MRTRLALVVLSAAALLLTAPVVRAQDYGSQAWNGSSVTVPASTEVGTVHVTAYFTRSTPRTINSMISANGEGRAGCPLPQPVSGSGRTPATFSADLSFLCNGTYSIVATAFTTDNTVLPADSAGRTANVAVSMPAPAVTGVNASGSGRSITVVWNDMTFMAPDLSGYVVERQIGDGAFTEIAVVGVEATSFVDDSLPTDAGQATYRVASTRPSPDGTKVSAASATGATPFVAAPASPPGDLPGDGTTGDGTTPGDGTTSGDGTTPGTSPGTPAPGPPGTAGGSGGSGPGGSGRPGGGGIRAPRLGISGTFLPPLLRPSSSLSPPTTIDGGFSDELPYDDAEPGEDDPVLPDDELASLFTDGAAGRGMAIPVATALVLAVWAFHLRFLARASRPIP